MPRIEGNDGMLRDTNGGTGGHGTPSVIDPRDHQYYMSEPRGGHDFVVDLPQGQRLANRFTVESRLGQGSVGAVYLVHDELRATPVALKVVPVTSDGIVSQLRHEVEQNSKVRDETHLIRVHDIHVDRFGGVELLLISMAYADGGSLRRWLIQNRDNAARRREEGPPLLAQACKGLRALHKAGILHLDLKPDNLLFCGPVLKVADLGLSACRGEASEDGTTGVSGQEAHGGGTPEYMSPEQFLPAWAGRLDERSDIYSVGVILFEMCDEQGRPPFAGSSDQIREAHLHMPIPQIRDVPAHVAHMISRCLQKDPAERYANVSELIDELEGRSTSNEDPSAAQRNQQIERLWQEVCSFVQGGRLRAAGSVCTEILALCPEHSEARHLLRDIQDRSERAHECCVTIQRAIGSQPLGHLVALLATAIEICPDHHEGALIRTQLGALAQEYKVVMQSAVRVFGQGQWAAALSYLARAHQLNPGQPAIARGIEFVTEVQRQIEVTRADIAVAIEQRNRQRALLLARRLDEYVEQVKALAKRSLASEVEYGTAT